MPNEKKSKRWEKILVHELFEYFFNFVFLAFFLVALAWYRRLLLASYNIDYYDYWAPVIEAAILAKIIMIGDALRMGRRFSNRPLAIPTIYRTILFSILVIIFSFAEKIIGALIHGKTIADGIDEITGKGWDFLLARCVLIIVAFLPFFTMKEIERVFGEERVRGMFFRGKPENIESGPVETRDSAEHLPSTS